MAHLLKGNIRNIYFYLPLIVLLFPTFPSYLPELLGFQLIFSLEVIIMMMCWSKRIILPKANIISNFILTTFTLFTVFDIYSDLIKGVNVFSDYFELIKPIAFIMFFWFYRFSIFNSDEIIEQTYKALVIIYSFLTIFTLLAFIIPDTIRPLEFLLYKRSSVPILANKAIGSFSTTYHFAFFLILPLTYSFILLLKKPSVCHFIMFSLILVSMLLTQSRSMYLCSGLCILLSFCCPILHETRKQRFITFFIIGCVIFIGIYLFIAFQEELYKNLTYAFEGLSAISDGGNNSVNIREQQINWALDNNSLLLVGAGIGKGEIMLESFYSLYYYRYGIIGMVISLTLFIVTSYKSYKIARNCSNDRNRIIFYALSVFYFLVPFSISSSCHMDSPKISFIFYGLMGLIFRKYSELNVSKLNKQNI